MYIVGKLKINQRYKPFFMLNFSIGSDLYSSKYNSYIVYSLMIKIIYK